MYYLEEISFLRGGIMKNKIKSRVPWDSEPRITVLARASNNLAVSQSVFKE
jgi:hypothetical protein